VDSAPVYAVITAALVQRLQQVMSRRGLTLRSAAQPAGIDPTSLSRLLTGKVVPDLGTVAALEQSLAADLWPGRVSGPRPG
jgi:transcriptional regulator with XRE-family HTH domain